LLAGNLSHKEGALGEDAARADRLEQTDGASPRLGISMTFVTLDNGFTYDTDVLKSSATYKRFERQREATLKRL